MSAHVLVRPPSRPSNGAYTIRQSLGNNARLSRVSPVPRQYKYVINWGNPSIFDSRRAKVYNGATSVQTARDKLESFKAWQAAGVLIPEFTMEKPAVGTGVWVARSGLTLSGGRGITIIRDGMPDVEGADLYVRYIPKLHEYRVHVVAGKVIFVQQKKRRNGEEYDSTERLIRSFDNGWVFCNVDEWEKELEDAACAAVVSVGLDFGAVDVVRHRDSGKYYILECNTAPGLLAPSLIEAYKKAFTEVLEL